MTAADLAVTSLAERWIAEVPASQAEADAINRRYEQRCRQLGIIYSDVDLQVEAKGGRYVSGPGWDRLPSCELV